MSEPNPNPPPEIVITFPGSVHTVEDSKTGRVIADKVREVYAEQIQLR